MYHLHRSLKVSNCLLFLIEAKAFLFFISVSIFDFVGRSLQTYGVSDWRPVESTFNDGLELYFSNTGWPKSNVPKVRACCSHVMNEICLGLYIE